MAPPISADPRAAARVLAAGGLVAFPTETVYGLGAHAEDPVAVRRVFAAKGRPADHPLIVHGHDAEVLDRYGRDVPAWARALASVLWPGPLTLVVPRGPAVPDAVTGGRPTVGLRVPDHDAARQMLATLGAGVAAPSANPFGATSPTRAAHVAADLGDAVDLILDGGPSRVGVESTILDASGSTPVVLRTGGVPRERLEEILGAPVADHPGGEVRAPGMLPAHYAPRAAVQLADDPGAARARAAALAAQGHRVAVLAAGPVAGLPDGVAALHPPAVTPEAYARALYDLLRDADARGVAHVVAVPPPPAGLGWAVRDRLERAAAAARAASPAAAETHGRI